MGFKKPSQELVDVLEEVLIDYPVETRKMFGCSVYFLNTNMMAGVFEDTIFARLPAERIYGLMGADDEITRFNPLKKAPMKEYAVLGESVHNDRSRLEKIIAESADYVLSLPEKEKNKRRRIRLF